MISRRDLVKCGAAAPVFATSAAALAPTGVDALLLDRRVVADIPFLRAGLRLYKTDGDVTPLWVETLDSVWRKPGFTLGGVTGKDVLFVLETLAWDRGRRVTVRESLKTNAGVEAFSWVIAPVHPSVRG